MNFQELIEKLNNYWSKVGLLIGQPYGIEVGAGTGNPNTFFRVLGPEPFNVAYVEPSRRPADGRYGENPNRLQHYFQYQIILKPAPSFHLDLYFGMLEYLGINPFLHDIRLVEDNWASPSLRAWGLGWEVWLDSMEVTQYTYFQQMGGFNLSLPTVEITLGLERLAMYIQNVDDYKELDWNNVIKYGDLFKQHEYYQSLYNFEQANVKTLFKLIDLYFSEINNLIKLKNFWTAYDYILKISHVFNILDARGVTSAEYRRELFDKIGSILNKIATLYVESRKVLGFPLKKKNWKINKVSIRSRLKNNIFTNKISTINQFANFSEIDLNKSFLLEIDFEDLPFEVLLELKDRIVNIIDKKLETFNINISKKEIILTPRRIGFVLENPVLNNAIRIIKGPPKNVIFDEYGKHTELYSRILAKYSDVIKTEIKDGFLYIQVKEVIDWNKFIADFVSELFRQLPFKYMNYMGKRVIRPIRSVIAFFNGKEFDLSELNLINFNQDFERNKLLLPIFLGGGKIKVNDIIEYSSVLDKFNVILEPDARMDFIRKEIKEKLGIDNVNVDTQKKLETVSMFVESPSVYLLNLPLKYKKLPDFLVNYILWKNQRFIDIKKGTFVVVANNPFKKATQNIKSGALKVSMARLEDGLFYFMKDKGLILDNVIKASQNISVGDRKLKIIKNRINQILQILQNELQINNKNLLKQFSFLWHVDLATNLGREFPALTGKIMSYYLDKSWFRTKEISILDKRLLSDVFNLSYEIENYNFTNLQAKIEEISKKSTNKNLVRDIVIFYIGVFIDDILYTIGKYGLPKGASDKYGVKTKIDGLFWMLYILYQYYSTSIDIQNILQSLLYIYDIKNITQQDMVSFWKKRLLNFIRKIITQQNIKKNTLYEDSKFISAISFSSGIKLPLLCFSYQNHKKYKLTNEQYEVVYKILKRVFNLIKLDANNFYNKYQYESSNNVAAYLGSLYKVLQRKASTKEYSNLYKKDIELLADIGKKLKQCHNNFGIQPCVNCNDFIDFLNVLKKVDKYINEVKIHGNKNINIFRKKLLLLVLGYSFLFINIRAWLGQGF